MNEYGRLAQSHWEAALPRRVASLSDPVGFFTDLGVEVQAQITETVLAMEAEVTLSTDYLTQVAQRNSLLEQARELVLADLVYLTPEENIDHPSPTQDHPEVRPDGMPTDLGHPLWAAVEDEAVTPEEFKVQLREWWQTLEGPTSP